MTIVENFMYVGKSRVGCVFGSVHITSEPRKIDIIDIFSMGLFVIRSSFEFDKDLCIRGPHKVVTDIRTEYRDVSATENTIKMIINML